MKLFDQLFVATAVGITAFYLASAAAQPSRTSSQAAPKVERKTSEHTHRLIVQVDTNDPATMTLALNNAANVDQYYGDLGELVEIDVVAFGPGLHMLRVDSSPVKERIKSIAESRPSISFKACGNTQENMAKAEKKTISLVPQATVVKSGVVWIMELQERGWSYIRP